MGHIKLVLEQLALLHATSYNFIQTYPSGGVEKFKEDFQVIKMLCQVYPILSVNLKVITAFTSSVSYLMAGLERESWLSLCVEWKPGCKKMISSLPR